MSEVSQQGWNVVGAVILAVAALYVGVRAKVLWDDWRGGQGPRK